MYQIIRPLLFKLDPEKAHALALQALQLTPGFCFSKPKKQAVKALGYTFEHPIGLAAGLDKNAQYLDALARLGFSFIEVGTVTPRPQPGNAKPRLFRVVQAQALINRMGFNNLGVDALVNNIQRAHYNGILGINIGKNKDTDIRNAAEDYLICLKKVYPYASYVTINISSPNTPDLRTLHQQDYFDSLISELRSEQLVLSDTYQRYVPLVVKVSPDESDEALKRIADTIVSHGIDGIIATNTTMQRYGIENSPIAKEAGGLSGKPLAKRATECLTLIKSVVGDSLTLIASGGIDCSETAKEKRAAGASLLQVYTGLIYQGPGLVNQLVEALE